MIASREIGRVFSEKNESKQLIEEAVEQIKKQFGYFFVAIYLVDEKKEIAVLQAATGKQGASLLSTNHRLRIREEGIVGYVISHGESRIVLDVNNKFRLEKPSDLPDIRSEMAIPLKFGDQIIGALDIQSEKDKAFSYEESDTLQSISDHLAMAIEKTRKNERLQLSINELEKASSTYSKSSWIQHLKGSRKNLSYRYSGSQLQKKDSLIPEEEKVLKIGEKMVVSGKGDNDDDKETIYLVPISLRDQTLGVLSIKYTDKHIPKEFEAVIEKTTERMAAAIENARLLEEIQDRADRERVIANISNKVRSARDIDSILQTTAAELGRALGVDEIRVQLKTREVD
jgi:GAF domain-containing protein